MDVKIVVQMWTIQASLLSMITSKQMEKAKRKISQLGNLGTELKIQKLLWGGLIKRLKIINLLTIN